MGILEIGKFGKLIKTSKSSIEHDIKELYDYFKSSNCSQFNHWWYENDSGRTFSLLTNGSQAMLNYLAFEGDAGFTSRNAKYSGDDKKVLDFIIDNGQVDEYPLKWLVPIDEALKATEFFILTGEKDPKLSWNDENEGTYKV